MMELTSEHRQILDFIKKQTQDFTTNLLEDIINLYPTIPPYQIAIALSCELQSQALLYLSGATTRREAINILQAFLLAKKAKLDGTNINGISEFLHQARGELKIDPTT